MPLVNTYWYLTKIKACYCLGLNEGDDSVNTNPVEEHKTAMEPRSEEENNGHRQKGKRSDITAKVDFSGARKDELQGLLDNGTFIPMKEDELP